MAVAAVGLLGLTGAGTGIAGFVIGIGAAVIDATVIMPWIAGKGRDDALSPRLQDNPVGSNQPGAPRIWAIGSSVRVPTHVLWQKEKVLEPVTTTHTKSGTTVTQRQVMVDCLIALNDRKTVEMAQLVGNGKLLVWGSRNLRRLTTFEMSAAVSGANVIVTMGNTLGPSPTDVFAVGEFVRLYGWVSTAGASINGSYWRISALTGHTSVPGTITLQVIDGQVVTGVAANAGNAFSPGHIERVDDALVIDPATLVQSIGTGAPNGEFRWGGFTRNVTDIFNSQDIVKPAHMQFASGPQTGQPVGFQAWRVVGFNGVDTVRMWPEPGYIHGGFAAMTVIPGGTKWPRLEYVTLPVSAGTFFAPGYVPKDHYYEGNDSQLEDSIIVATLGTGNVPAYRGVAYQAISEFRVTAFGGQLPYSLEAIIRPDLSMTWAQALYETLRRAGVPAGAINVEGVSLSPFLGYYIRGHVPTATSIQPLLLAKQIVGQDRNGVLCLFQIENADVSQVENGAVFSDLGAHIYGDDRADDKVITKDGAEEDLPTSIGVRHQDPDNVYSDGYQVFGIRNPTGPTYENRVDIDVSTLVLTRKDAKNLATTTVRRSWMNNRTYEWVLSACYLDQLENDVQTLTDDDGNVLIGRTIQRDIGANYLVSCALVREDLTLAVSGSPVQPAAGIPPPIIVQPAQLIGFVLDCSSMSNDQNHVPMLRFACCAVAGGHWAGGRLFESTDGSNWTPVDFLMEQSTIGLLTLDLPARTASEVLGSPTVTFHTDAVTVLFEFEGEFGIQPCTQQDARTAQRNWCAIFDIYTGEVELAAFTSVTLISPREYTLNGWLRGLRGTKPLAKIAGRSQLVMLGPTWEHPTLTRSYPGLSQQASLAFKFVPVGLSVEEVEPIQVVSTWRNCRPLPIRDLVKTIGPSPFNARFTVSHWTREHLPVGYVGPYSMDEPFEGYKFSIYEPGGTAVRRIKWLLATPGSGTPTLRDKSVDYTPAEQTADGYTPGAATTFVVDVQQVGFLGQVFGLSDSNKRTV